MSSQSVYEAAHKGDYDYVRSKVEEDSKLLLTTDSVSTNSLCVLLSKQTIYCCRVHVC